jgi:hypothetical protein
VSSGMSTPNGIVDDSLDPLEIIDRYTWQWFDEENLQLSEESGVWTTSSTSIAIDSSYMYFTVGTPHVVKCTITPVTSGINSFEGQISTYATFTVNTPPSSGSCVLDAYWGIAYISKVTVTCSN